MKDYFKLINSSNYIQNINQGKTGLIKGICNCYDIKYPISKERAIKMATKWKPYRSVATWYFWRSLDPIPVEY